MTTNQTIDGVPRSTIELAIGGEGLAKAAAIHELRALLDAPAKLPVIDAHNERLIASLRSRVTELEAAQPQGEPVNQVRSHGSCCWEDIIGESLELVREQPEEYEVRTLYRHPQASRGEPVVLMELVENNAYDIMHIAKWDNPGGLKEGFHKLYAEQPAPVAVVLPEHRDSDLRSPTYGFARGWNACLDEVARLTATVRTPEPLVMTDGLHTYEYVTGHSAAIDKMLGVKS